MSPRQQLIVRIENYLGNGGLFNPECMAHDKVRDLLLDCRAVLSECAHLDDPVPQFKVRDCLTPDEIRAALEAWARM